MNERQMPENFGGVLWADHTLMQPPGLVALLLALLAVLLLPRRYAILPLLLIAVALPGAQRIAVFSLDFTFIRIIILATLSAAALRGHFRGLRLGMPDVLLILWMCWGLIAYGLLTNSWHGVVTSAGGAVDSVGAYLIGRLYIRSLEDLRRLLVWLGIISLPMLVLFLLERITGYNFFSVFGGVPEEIIVRNGRLRVQGPFAHPIMAGVFWASLLPCLGALWMAKVGSRTFLTIAILCMGLLVINTASSTPVMAVLCGMFGMSLFVLRRYMRWICGGALLCLIGLHLSMQSPVWHLISRIDLSNGSTGWHRYNLIQQAINHFDEWWQIGTTSTAHWGWGLQDITNQYIYEGVNGGLLQMLLFVGFLGSIFLRLGSALRRGGNRAEQWLLWGSGVALFTHCVSFLAVAYFGQMVNLFYLFAGGVVGVTSLAAYRRAPARSPALRGARPTSEVHAHG